jgi:hypothetical protein
MVTAAPAVVTTAAMVAAAVLAAAEAAAVPAVLAAAIGAERAGLARAAVARPAVAHGQAAGPSPQHGADGEAGGSEAADDNVEDQGDHAHGAAPCAHHQAATRAAVA